MDINQIINENRKKLSNSDIVDDYVADKKVSSYSKIKAQNFIKLRIF